MELKDRDKKYILHPFTTYRAEERNIPIAKGSGASVWDEDGKQYIDAVGSWWVNLHGHAHPYINQKIKDQLDELEHVMFSGFTHRPAVELAEKLLRHLEKPYTQIFYSDNGSTAVEVALKMAIQYWRNNGEDRRSFIAFRNSYHGDTFGAMSVSERDVFVAPFEEHMFNVHYIDLPGEGNLETIMEELQKLIEQHRPVGFIFEPLVQGAGGMRMYDPEKLDAMIKLCKQHHVFTIADEVMTGFGRTGKEFAIQYLDARPDFICLSKGLTGGYLPLGVTAYTDEVAVSFAEESADKTFYHGHSFTANPISCTAALASLELMEKESTKENIRNIESSHRAFIEKIKNHDLVEEARAFGVIMAFDIKLPSDEYFYLHPVKNALYSFFIQEGIILRPLGNVVYLIPPYCISSEELQTCYRVIEKGLEYLQAEYS